MLRRKVLRRMVRPFAVFSTGRLLLEQALRTLVQACGSSDNTTCPQLILLDMNMPVLNGLGFLEAYVQMPLAQQRALVIVMLTTSLHPVDLAKAQQLPIVGFLNKPLTHEKIHALLREHFVQPLP